MSVSPRLKIATVALALVAAVVPTPASWIERVYSERSYLSVQRLITSASNLVPIALLDVGCLVLLISFLLHSLRILRRPAASRWPLRRLVLVDAITLLAAVYLLFLAVWGLNYRREPLRARLQFDRGRVSQSALLQTTREVVRRLNDLDGSRSRDDGPALDAVPQLLVRPFVRTQELLGQPRIALGGVPKASLLREYFRRTAISGMTNPFFLEVIINDELVPSERPFVVAHEWAHLAGYADEAEASFVAWLTCVRGDAIAQYSGWLSLLPHLVSHLEPRRAREVMSALAAGPRRDLRAIAARIRRASPTLSRAADRAYDRFLKANRVEAGIESYDEVVALVLGTTFRSGWAPERRKRP